MKKVLVTGGAGYVGSVLVEELLKKKFAVRVFDCLLFGKNSLLQFGSDENFELLRGRLENESDVKLALDEADFVIHLADLANDPACELSPELSKRIILDGTKKLVAEANRVGIERMVFASSCSVYGFNENALLTEESELNPISLYAKFKKENEKVILSEKNDFAATALRKATIYGYSPRQRLDLVVNIMTAKAIRLGKIIVNGGNQWRPNLHVRDAAKAYILCLEAGKQKIDRQIFNVGSNAQNHKIIDIARMVKKTVPRTELIVNDSVDNRSYNVCFDKIGKKLGFKPSFGVLDGVRELKRVFENDLIVNINDPIYHNVKQMIATNFVEDS